MTQFPQLPGINIPLQKADKEAKLAQRTEDKKSILLAKRNPEVAGLTVDPFLAEQISQNEGIEYALDKAIEARRAREQHSLVSDAALDTVPGQAGNMAGHLAEGAANAGGWMASAPMVAAANAALEQVSDESRQIYGEELQYKNQQKALSEQSLQLKQALLLKQITPEQAAAGEAELQAKAAQLKAPDPARIALLDQKAQGDANSDVGRHRLGLSDRELGSPTLSDRERIEQAKQALNLASTVEEAVSGSAKGLANSKDREKLDAQMSASWDAQKETFDLAEQAWESGDRRTAVREAAKGIVNFAASGTGDLVDNPAAVLGYVAENIPQVAVGAFGRAGKLILGSSNLAYSTDLYRQGLEDYQQKNDGRLPSQAEAQEMLAYSLAAGALDQTADISLLKSLPDKASRDVTRGVTQRLGEVGKAAITGVASELPTEGIQTAIETGYSKLQEPDWEQTAKGALIGGAVGGSMKAGFEASQLPGDLRTAGKQRLEQNQALKASKLFEEASTTGNVDAFADSKSKDYSVNKAVQALRSFSEKDDVDAEIQQKKAEDLVGVQTKALNQLQQAIDSNEDPEWRTSHAQKLEELKAQAEGMEAGVNKEKLLTKIGVMEGFLWDDKTLESRKSQLAKLQEDSAAANLAMNEWKGAKADAAIADDIELADRSLEGLDEVEAQKTQEAVDRTISLAMRSPNDVSIKTAERLASNTNNSLTLAQRDMLNQQALTQRELNSLKGMRGVSQEVLFGGKGFAGLKNYLDKVSTAVSSNNAVAAEKAAAGLENFAQVHQAKLDAIEAAFDRFYDTKQTQVIENQGDGVWVPSSRPVSDANGTTVLRIDPLAQGLAANIELEVNALKQGALAARAQVKAFQEQQQKEAIPAVPKAEIPAPAKPAQSEESSAVQEPGEIEEEVYDLINRIQGRFSRETSEFERLDAKDDRNWTAKESQRYKELEDLFDTISTVYEAATAQNISKGIGNALNQILTPEEMAEIKALRKKYKEATAKTTSTPEVKPQAKTEEGAESASRQEEKTEELPWDEKTTGREVQEKVAAPVQAEEADSKNIEETLDALYASLNAVGIKSDLENVITYFYREENVPLSVYGDYAVLLASVSLQGLKLEIRGPNSTAYLSLDSKGKLALSKKDRAPLEVGLKALSLDDLTTYLSPGWVSLFGKIQPKIGSNKYGIDALEIDFLTGLIALQKEEAVGQPETTQAEPQKESQEKPTDLPWSPDETGKDLERKLRERIAPAGETTPSQQSALKKLAASLTKLAQVYKKGHKGKAVDALARSVQELQKESAVELEPEVQAFSDMLVSAQGPVSIEDVIEWMRESGAGKVRLSLMEAIAQHPLMRDFKGYSLDLPSKEDLGLDYQPLGVYFPDQHSVAINPLQRVLSGEAVALDYLLETVVHEALHAISDKAIEADSDLRAEIESLQQIAREWMNGEEGQKLPEDLASRVNYALNDVHEFLTVALTAPDVATVLGKIQTGNQSVLGRLMQTLLGYMKKALKLSSAESSVLAEALRIGGTLLGDTAGQAVNSVEVNEHPSSGYQQRTQFNADSAGVTVAIADDFETAGERLTRKVAGQKYVHVSFENVQEAAKALVAKLTQAKAQSLNIAGNGIYTLAKFGRTQAEVNQYVYDLIKAVHQQNPLTKIVTGGQTGVDIAGAIAAKALGIPVVVTMPKGFVQRNEQGKDLRLSREAVLKQIEEGAKSLTTTEKPVQTAEAANTPSFEDDVATGERLLKEAAEARKREQQAEEALRRAETWLDENHKIEIQSGTSDYVKSTEGVLDIVKNELPIPTADEYQTTNLISAYYKQDGARSDSITPRPLVAVKNFIEHLKNGDTFLFHFLAQPLSEEQMPVVNHFLSVHDEWAASFTEMLQKHGVRGALKTETDSRYHFRDPIRFFLDENKQIEPNALTAFMAALYGALGDLANEPQFKTFEDVRTMVGEESWKGLSDENPGLYDRLKWASTRRLMFQASLGGMAVKALGLKEKNQHVPVNELSRLEANIGGYLVAWAMKQGLLVEIALKDGNEVEHNFLAVNRDAQGNLPDLLKYMNSIYRHTGGVMDNLFGMEQQALPLLQAPKVVQDDTFYGLQDMPAEATRAFKEIAKRKYNFRPLFHTLVGGTASTGFLERVAGIEETDIAKVHKARRESHQAANDNLRRELQQLKDLVAYMRQTGNEGKPFYALPELWKNSRMGYKHLWANMQTSKIARFLVAPEGWNVTVSQQPGAVAGKVSLDNFKLRVMEGLGAKTDSTPDVDTLAGFDSLTGKYQAAVDVLAEILKSGQKMTPEQEDTVASAVEKATTNLHALEALYALAQWKNAGPEADFEVSLTTEIDGKTNGPMLSLWLLGVMDEAFAAMGGFYSRASEIVSFGHWKPGRHDLYQAVASSMTQELALLSEGRETLLAAVYNVTGKLVDEKGVTSAGRNEVKNPLTTLVYGSGMEATLDGMAETFLEKLYQKIEALSATGTYAGIQDNPDAAFAQLREDLSVLTGIALKDLPATIEKAMETKFSNQIEARIKRAHTTTIGEAMQAVIETDLRDYIEARKVVVAKAGLTFNVYEMMREEITEAFIQELIAQGEMPFREISKEVETAEGQKEKVKVKEALTGLSKAQLDVLRTRLQAIEPRMNTVLSAESSQLDAGIFMAKREGGTSTLPQYASEVRTVGEHHKAMGNDKEVKNPGVSVMANGVQSSDGGIMVPTVATFNSVGVHDAILVNPLDAPLAGEALNERTAEVLLKHSLPRESMAAMERTLVGLLQYLQANPDQVSAFAPKLEKQLSSTFKTLKLEGSWSFSNLLDQLWWEQHAADVNRLTLLSEMGVFDQYTLEEGVYEATDDFRNEAKRQLDTLEQAVPAALQELGSKLDELLAKTAAPAKKPASTQAKGSKPQASLDEFLQSKEDLTLGELVAFVRTRLAKDTTTMGKVYAAILAQLVKVADLNTPVRYITAARISEIPQGMEDALGWFHQEADGSNAHIGIRGSDLPGSAVTTELAVHEALHAAVAGIIASALQGVGTAAVKAAVKDLESLLKETRERLKAEDPTLLEQFAEALSGIQEFVTWGMTNQAFQDKLKGLEYTNEDKSLVTRAKNFAQKLVETLSRIVFGNPTPEQTTHLSLLFAQVSVLMTPESKAAAGKAEVSQAQRKRGYRPDVLNLFDGLRTSTNSTHQASVREMVSAVVESLGGPFEVFLTQEAAKYNTAAEVIEAAQLAGEMPSSTALQGNGFVLSDQDKYAIELLETALAAAVVREGIDPELVKLYEEASAKIKPQDLHSDPVVGQAQWDALFGVGAVDAQGRYLARFAAMALVHEDLAQQMGFATNTLETPKTSLYERIVGWVLNALNVLKAKMHKAYAGQQADEKLKVLTRQLLAIEAKHQFREEAKQNPGILDKFEDSVQDVQDKIRGRMDEFGQSNFFQGKKNPFLNLTGNLISAVAAERVPEILKHTERLYFRMTKGQMGLVASMLNEAWGTRDSNIWGRTLSNLTKIREKLRQETKNGVGNLVLEGFADSGKNLTEEDRSSLTAVLLRTGAHVLLDQQFSLNRIEDLLRNPTQIKRLIRQYESQLSGKFRHYYANQAHLLGYYLATGESRGPHLLMNVTNIARMYGTQFNGQVTDAAADQIAPVIDTLATLYALKYLKSDDRLRVADVMRKEADRVDGGNGAHAMLLMHKQLLQEAKERVFQGSENLMQKGYVSEVHNPYLDVQVVTMDKVAELLAQGYVDKGEVKRDPDDHLWKPKRLMVAEKIAPRYVSGNFSMTDMTTKGSTVHSGHVRFNQVERDDFNLRDTRRIRAKRNIAINSLLKPNPQLNPEAFQRQMAPVIDSDGDVANYRYMMDYRTRDVLLERNNDMSVVLGTLASSTYDKESTRTHNKQMVEGLYQQWQQDQIQNPEAYILVGPDSRDPDIRERWLRLPKETRKEIQRVWSSENMMMRRDTLDLHLGYPKLSFGASLAKDSQDRNAWEKVFAFILEDMFRLDKKAILKVLRAEHMILEANKQIREWLVVKSGVTLFWNVISNLSLLYLHNVPIMDIWRYHRQALGGALQWHKDSQELFKLQQLKSTGYVVGVPTDLDRRIAVLESQMANNPVRETMLMGMMPSIVEDVDMEEGADLYQTEWEKAVDRKLALIPDKLKGTARVLYMAHDTKLFQFLHLGTQLSDYVARYTLYEHLKNNRRNPMDPTEAAQEAIDSFVNYDVPTHRGLQFLNDVGLTRFTKYYLRIQKVILKRYGRNPLRLLTLGLLDNYFTGAQTIMDSALWNQGMPSAAGSVLDFPEAIEAGLLQRMLGKVF